MNQAEFLAGVAGGTIRAVSDDESVDAFLAISAEWRRTDGAEIPRSKWKRVNHVCEQFEKLRGELRNLQTPTLLMDPATCRFSVGPGMLTMLGFVAVEEEWVP